MPGKRRPEELVPLKTLHLKGQSHVQIAHTLGVTEGTVRYHLRRLQTRAHDRRRDKPRKAEPLASVIAYWVGQRPATRPINVRALYDHVVAEHAYGGSYRSVLRFVRDRYPGPKPRPFRRVETPPGA